MKFIVTFSMSLLIQAYGFAQFTQQGQLDSTFNYGIPHAYFTNSVSPALGTSANDAIHAVAVQSDGKIIIGGNFSEYNGTPQTRIARLNEDGSLDNSFSVGSGFNNVVYAIAIQPDGKILVAGVFSNYNGTSRNGICRLNSNGSIDATFTSNNGPNAAIRAIAILPDGKIMIGGLFTSYHISLINRVARLNPNGSIDATFNPGSGTNGGPNNNVLSLAVQSDGKVLLGGAFWSYAGNSRLSIVRVNTNGSLDTSFNIGSGASSWVQAIQIQTDGKILIGGSFGTYNGTSRNRIARLNFNGSLDTSFNPGTGMNGPVTSLVLQTDGKIIAGGQFTSFNGIARNRIVRINSNGTLDTAFNPGSGANSIVSSLRILSNGRILIAGEFANYNGLNRGRIAVLNSNGSNHFNFSPIPGLGYAISQYILCSTQQPDGKIIIGGGFTMYNGVPRNRIARLNPDGSLDLTFDPGTGANNVVTSLAVRYDGKILVGGDFLTFDGINRRSIVLLNANGGVDTLFSTGAGPNGRVKVILVQPDSQILIAGEFTSIGQTNRARIARLNTDGSIDWSFNPGTAANDGIDALGLRSDGKMMIGGRFTSYAGTTRNRIARLNANGTLDATFNPISGASGAANATVQTISIQSDNKMVIGGTFTGFNGMSRNRITRINEDGSLDVSFNIGTGANNTVFSTVVLPDDKMILAGNFTQFNGAAHNYMLRLNPNGSVDPSFSTGSGPNATIQSMSMLADGRLFIVGFFTAYNGVVRPKAARILNCYSPTIKLNGGQLSVISGFSTYQWFRNDTLIPGATSPIYTPLSSGNFKVVTTSNTFPCGGISNSISVTVAGLEDNFISLSQQVYPNPSTGLVTINTKAKPADVRLYTLQGVLLPVRATVHEEGLILDISEFNQGLYLLQVGEAAPMKLVKE